MRSLSSAMRGELTMTINNTAQKAQNVLYFITAVILALDLFLVRARMSNPLAL